MTKIKFAERRISDERSEVIALAADRYEIEMRLHPCMRDAEREIAKYFQMQTAGMGYAVSDPNRTGPSEDAPDPTDEELAILIARMGNLKAWKAQCPSAARGVVIDVQVFGFALSDVAAQRGVTDEDVIRLYVMGLKAYCKIRGWM